MELIMRILAAAILVGLTAPLAGAADKDEVKAKEAAVAFLNAVKAKDLDLVMKTVDVPLLYEFDREGRLIEKSDELKKTMTAFLAKIEPEQVPSELGSAVDLPGLRKLFEGREESDRKMFERIETVTGRSGYAIYLKKQGGREAGALHVRIKDGKAVVVGIPH